MWYKRYIWLCSARNCCLYDDRNNMTWEFFLLYSLRILLFFTFLLWYRMLECMHNFWWCSAFEPYLHCFGGHFLIDRPQCRKPPSPKRGPELWPILFYKIDTFFQNFKPFLIVKIYWNFEVYHTRWKDLTTYLNSTLFKTIWNSARSCENSRNSTIYYYYLDCFKIRVEFAKNLWKLFFIRREGLVWSIYEYNFI